MLTLTPSAYANIKIERDMFSRTDPGGIPRDFDIKGRAGDDIEDPTGLIAVVKKSGTAEYNVGPI